MTTTVADVLDAKQSAQVLTVSPDDTVQFAIEIMASKSIGSLPVVENSDLVGIISERDYIRKAAPKRQLPWEILIKELMTTEVIHVGPDETVENCMRLMVGNRIRHLPVLQGDDLVGIVSITDLIRKRSEGRYTQ